MSRRVTREAAESIRCEAARELALQFAAGRVVLVACEIHDAQQWLTLSGLCPYCVFEGRPPLIALGEACIDVVALVRERDEVLRFFDARAVQDEAAQAYVDRLGRAGPPEPVRVLVEVARERARQDAKWGPQDHPDADPVIVGLGLTGPDLCMELEIPSQERAKELCRAAGNRGADHWGAILVEELAEAVEAIGNDAALRAELVQVAAVAVAWIEAVDRRQAVSRG